MRETARASNRTKHRRFDTVRCDFTERRLVYTQLAHCAGATACPKPVGNVVYAAAGVTSNPRFSAGLLPVVAR